MSENPNIVGKNRFGLDVVKQDAKMLSETPFFFDAINAINNWVVVVNNGLQIVASNSTILKDLGFANLDSILGKRIGEVLNCVHKNDFKNGCGTSKSCRFCGAIQSLIESQNDTPNTKECRITTRSGEDISSLDLRVKATPITIDDKKLTIVNIQNIAEEKRNLIFNKLIGKYLFTDEKIDILKEAQELREDLDVLEYLTPSVKHLFDESRINYFLLDVESGNLVANMKDIDLNEVIYEVIRKYQSHPVANQKVINFVHSSNALKINSDAKLLKMAISIMIENALEASDNNESIKVIYQELDDKVVIEVKNSVVIPADELKNLYQRHFSTKGKDRGLGTYVLRILADQYLNARTYAESEINEGTRFYLVLSK